MLTKEVIGRVHSLYSRGVSSDESRLSSRHTYNKLLSVRMTLLTQQAKKKQKLSDWNYSILDCVELIKVPRHECSCLGDLGCDIYRTKYALPKVLTDSTRHHIEYVMSIDSGMRIEEVTRQGVLYLKGNKYTGHKPKYLFENGFLYFPLKKSPGLVRIKLLAEDPIEAAKFPSLCPDCTDCEDCTPAGDYEFKIDGDLIEPLIELTLKELFNIFSQIQEDNKNDSRDRGRPEGR